MGGSSRSKYRGYKKNREPQEGLYKPSQRHRKKKELEK